MFPIMQPIACLFLLTGLTGASSLSIGQQFYQECQFRIESLSHKNIVDECGPKNEIRAEFLLCSQPFIAQAHDQILKECCSKCHQCSGCEDDGGVTTDQYEKDSPGEVPINDAVEVVKPTSDKLRK